jgi:predicted phosphodiesterase
MRIAVIADIHGNLPALEAVLADIARRSVDQTVNLGDCVSGPLWPRETMDLLDRLGLATVRGNHDRWVAEMPRHRMFPSDVIAYDALTCSQRTALGALPPLCRFGQGIAAVHGTPGDDNDYLLEVVVEGRLALAPRTRIDGHLAAIDCQLLLCAHSHVPRVVEGGRGVLIVNPGSVGCPAYADPTEPAHVSEVGSPHARYAVLSRRGSDWSVDLLAIPYDWSAASRRAQELGRTDWAWALSTGFMAERGET